MVALPLGQYASAMTHITGRQRWARIAAWTVSLGATICGIVLVAMGKISMWVSDPSTPNTYTNQNVQVGLLGIVLLAVGLLSVMAVLIAEGYTRRVETKNQSLEPPQTHEVQVHESSI
ncbi:MULTISPECIES: hypothetical protein [unclassified Arthrobacter]|uniref:hypothetical protein n=1 Tax=unclassified Arthrobacter TaxID=235627 RepID=UPI0028F6F887|nr:hypothetical protein [Arthrobacter sp. lap29]